MRKILQQLYNGQIRPAEQYHPTLEKYKKMRKEHCQQYEDFIKELKKSNTSLDKRFIQIMDEQLDTLPFETSEMFIDGFCLGAGMILEILYNNQSLN